MLEYYTFYDVLIKSWNFFLVKPPATQGDDKVGPTSAVLVL